MRKKLQFIGCIAIYGILAAGLVWLLYEKNVFPLGEHIWETLYKADNLLDGIKSGNGILYYDSFSGNGSEFVRFSEPLPCILLTFFAFLGNQNAVVTYALFVGTVFFLSASSIFGIGRKENRSFMGFLLGLAYFFMPANLHMLFSKGNVGESIVLAFLPLFFWQCYRFVEEKSLKAVVSVSILSVLFVMCSVSYTIMVITAAVCYLLLDGIINGTFRNGLKLVPAFLLAFLWNGIWLCAYLKKYGTIPKTSAEKAAFYQALIDSLNPMQAMKDGTQFWYLGLSVFVLLLFGILFSKRKTNSFFAAGLVFVIFSTTGLSGVIKSLPGFKNMDMAAFFPMVTALLLVGFLLWKTLRKELVLICVIGLFLDIMVAVSGYAPTLLSQDINGQLQKEADAMFIEEAGSLTQQRVAIFADQKERSIATYLLAKSGKELSVTQGCEYETASIPKYLGQLEQALADGKYLYLFERCLELGDDTIIIEKEKLWNGDDDVKKLTNSAEQVGYVKKEENDNYLMFHIKTDVTFGVKSEYQAIGIGSSAGMMALQYPNMQETSSTNLNDYTYEQLSKYQCIYLNGFTYDDKEAAEQLITKLGENGVKVVIEASGIPADIVSKNREFLGVTCNDISFEKGYPILYTESATYDCNLFADGYEDWKTVYVIGLTKELGYFYENQDKIDFMGTAGNDNIIVIGLNLGYHGALTGDPMVEEIYDGLFGLDQDVLPERELVPVQITYQGNSLSIKADSDVNTTLAYHDTFICDKEVTEQNQLLYVKKGTTDISIKPAYLGAGAFLIFVGFAFAVPYYDYLIETSKGRKQKNER